MSGSTTSVSTTSVAPCSTWNYTTAAPDSTGDVTTGAIAIFGMFFTLLFAALMERVKSSNPVPFTICMIAFGSVLGGIAHASQTFDTDILFTEMNPMDILNIFIPILIFDGSFNLKLSTLAKVTFGSILLAGPGVVVNAFMMAGVMLPLYTNWGLAEALLFGSIVSATDPVAVIATLKDLDADRWTTTLTDGEAIINDGTAVVMYEMLRGAVRLHASDPNVGEVFVSVLRYCVVPIPLGLFFGFIISYAERRSPTKPVVVTIIQLGGAYVCYFIAANLIGTSTVLTIMIMAVYMSSQKSLYPKGDYDQAVHNFWEILVWIANALIFALVGIISVLHVVNKLDLGELWRILVVYVAINIARGLMLLMSWPFINYNVEKESDRMNWKRWAMLTYGGLRGGMALLLGLAVLQEKRNDATYANQCFVQVAGIVLLTSIINGWTAGPVVNWLGLDAKAAFSHHAILQAVEEVRATAGVRLLTHKMSENDVFFIDWAFVMEKTVGQIEPPTNKLYSYESAMTRSSTQDENARELIRNADESEMRDQSPRRTNNNNNNYEGGMSPTASNDENNFSAPLVQSAFGPSMIVDRSRVLLNFLEKSPSAEVMIPILLRVMKRELWRMFDSALITGRTISVLENFLETSMSDSKLFTADDLHEHLISPERFTGLDYKLRGLFSVVPTCSVEEEREELIVMGSIAFHRIMQRIHQGISVLYGSVSGTQVWLEWAKTVMDHAEDLSVMVRVDHPRVARIVDSRRVAQEILGEAQESVDTIALFTGLTGKQRQWLDDKLFRLTFLVSQEAPAPLMSDQDLIANVFNKSAITETCTEDERQKLWNGRSLCSASQSETIRLEKGRFGIVISGRITHRDRITLGTASNVSMDYFGLSYNIRGLDASTLALTAECSCAYLSLPFSVLDEIMQSNKACRDAVYRREASDVIEPLLGQVYPTCSLSPFQRKLLTEHAELVLITSENRHPVFKRIRSVSSPASPVASPPRNSQSAPPTSAVASAPLSVDNRTIFLLRGSSQDLPHSQCLTVIPETLQTRWAIGTVLLVLNDLALMKQLVPVTGVFFMDRAHVHIDIAMTSFAECLAERKQGGGNSIEDSSMDMLLFTLDRLLYALTEYIPCLIAVVHLLEKSDNGSLDQVRASSQDLMNLVSEWIFLRHMGGLDSEDVISQLSQYFDKFVRNGQNWSLQLVPWCKEKLAATSTDEKTEKCWSYSAFNVLSGAEIENLSKNQYHIRIPVKRSHDAVGLGFGDFGRVAASTSDTVFVSSEEK